MLNFTQRMLLLLVLLHTQQTQAQFMPFANWKQPTAGGASNTFNWAWEAGSKTVINRASTAYGTLGTGATTNNPGMRSNSISWTDASGNLWIFGGSGYDSAGTSGYLNDLWKFTPSTNKWTWVGGSNVVNQAGTYGTLGTGSTSNIPGAREGSVSWIDSTGNLWLFGGLGYATSGGSGNLNDLWEFTPGTNQWTWVSGSNIVNQAGTYGTLGTGSASNTPGARYYSSSWIDAAGNLWLFGGSGYASSGGSGYLNDLWEFTPSTRAWTWISGSNSTNSHGTHGTLGLGSISYTPSATSSSSSWIDASGNLWLFGGYGYDPGGTLGYLNDLWKFTPSTKIWTWVKGYYVGNTHGTYGTLGTGATTNNPGTRLGSSSWIDGSGNLWLFGGYGYDSPGNVGYLDDLWEYAPGTNKWTWISGYNANGASGTYGVLGAGSTSNIPGGRYYSSSWIDASGNLWLFGGSGYYPVGGMYFPLNDLWEYTPSTNKWTWVSGPNTLFQTGTYGTLGTGSASNIPGARENSSSWIDASGNLWLLGGYGYDSVGTNDYLNDLWEFTPSTKKWTWISGSVLAAQAGIYGTLGTGSTSNTPGARGDSVSWIDSSGSLWLFGGQGYDSVGSTYSPLNDLWEFTPSTNKWTWISGSNVYGAPGTYGTLGTGSTGNTPGARQDSVSWIDSSGNLWLFGGQGYDSAGSLGSLNDLWEFTPSTKKWTWISGSNVINASGTYGTLGTGATSNTPGSKQGANSWIDSSGNLWLFGGFGGGAIGAWYNDLWEFTPSTKKWTWVSGSNVDGASGIYGSLGIGSTSNAPGARNYSSSWIDGSGNLWLFGGGGYDSAGFNNYLNDLWEFTPSTKKWTWVSGSNVCCSSGTYSTLGTGSTSNTPSAKQGASSWIDASGNLWLFGGYGVDSLGTIGTLNDLWMGHP